MGARSAAPAPSAPSGASSNRKSEITGSIDLPVDESAERRADAAAARHPLQAALVLVGVEAVDDVPLAGARPQRRQVREAGVEGHQAERVLEEHRRHADAWRWPARRRGDRHAVDAAARRRARRRRPPPPSPCSAARTRGRSAARSWSATTAPSRSRRSGRRPASRAARRSRSRCRASGCGARRS